MANALLDKTPPPETETKSRAQSPEPRHEVGARTPLTPSPHPLHILSQQISPIPSPIPSQRTSMEDIARLGRDMRRKIDFKETGRNRNRSNSRSKSPGNRTGTSTRGSSWTHTLYLKLTRDMSLIQTVDPDPTSTYYKRLRSKLTKSMDQVERHLYEDEASNIDPAYTDDLEALWQEAEELLCRVDDEGDQVEQERQDLKRKDDLIIKCLPKAHAIKWDGTRQDYMRFKAEAQTLIARIPDNRLALNGILDIISDQKLCRTLARSKTPQEALESLELRFGNPELSGPQIIKDLQHLTRATTAENEAALILKIKEFFAQLTEIHQQHLLGVDVLYNLCHKFRERQGEAMIEKLKTEKDPTKLRTLFCEQMDSMYTTNTIWSRTNLEKDRRPEGPRGEHRDGIKKPNIYTNTRRSATEHVEERVCKICKGDHFNHQCDEVEEMDLNQVEKLGLCPHCLWGKHDDECPHIKKATFICKHCNLHYKLKKLHIQCSSWNDTTQTN